jgi:hypothetical protein
VRIFRGGLGLRGLMNPPTGPPPPPPKVMTVANGSEGRGKKSFSCAAALRTTVKHNSAVTSNRKRLTFVILAEIPGTTGIFTLDVLSIIRKK